MSNPKFIPPTYNENAFNCPHCEAYAHQKWIDNHSLLQWQYGFLRLNLNLFEREPDFHNIIKRNQEGIMITQLSSRISWAICMRCSKASIWLNKKMLFPDSIEVSMPNEDLDDEIKEVYMEAASVLQKSPCSAAALLRLALEKLCRQLDCKGKDLYENIGHLAEKGLPQDVEDAMDSIRNVGNKAIHSGKIDLRDDDKTAKVLFDLINFISEEMLTKPKGRKKFLEKWANSKKQKNRNDKSNKAN